MGIHQIFAQNLRDRSARFESIAEACIQIGVNRQQFNKYLSGAMLPNARTLRRICQAFGIEEWELFLRSKTQVTEAQDNTSSTKETALQPSITTEFLKNTLPNFTVEPVVNSGFYFCYFPMPSYRGFAVMSKVMVSKSAGCLSFIRHTKISSPSNPAIKLAQGKHHGTVISNGNMDYLIGYNSVAPMNVSFMAFPRESTELKVGLAIIHGLNQHFACRVVLENLGQSLRNSRNKGKEPSIVATGSSTFNPMIAKILDTPTQDIAGQLTLLNIEKLMFNHIGTTN